MKKRRSTVYVRPGKDVTLYIPVETPQEVIDYLNQLKTEGMFSQGVMEVLTRHVQHQAAMSILPAAYAVEPPAIEIAASVESLDQSWSTTDEVDCGIQMDGLAALPAANPTEKLELAQIFRQAKRNASKLTDSRATTESASRTQP